MIGRWHGLIIDCPDPSKLASFYEELLGMIRVQDGGDWVVIGDAADRPGVAFQRASDYHPPTWPDPAVPQQSHLDVIVDDLDEAEARVLAIGARATGVAASGFRAYLDLSGHPFCLCLT